MSLVEAVFWASAGAVLYSTFGYPLLLLAVASLRRPVTLPPLADDALPGVAVLVAAHNEERHLEERVRNLLAL